ncbi:MAG: ATP-binding protein [Chlamydiae bacterium]|nr:ATP-binding protein [Chlamydiota bacterium]
MLATQNPHWTNKRYDCGVERECFTRLLDYLDTEQIVAITGVRRAGKSTLVKQLINHLIFVRNIPAGNILFLNLEHPYLSPYKEDVTILQRIYEDYLKITQPQGVVYAFLDEVQFFDEWPVFVKSHHETKQVRFVVTESNAIMLSSDLVTMLSGRSLTLEVFPFSFRELASNRGIQVNSLKELALKTPEIRRLLDEFLEYGGFPTVALKTRSQTAFEILGAHAKTVLLQDVVPRLGARKPEDLEKLYVYLVSNISKLFSYLSLSKLFGISDKSIKEYIEGFSKAHLIYEVDLFSYSLKTQLRSHKKIYSIDTGQANAMGFRFSANRG